MTYIRIHFPKLIGLVLQLLLKGIGACLICAVIADPGSRAGFHPPARTFALD